MIIAVSGTMFIGTFLAAILLGYSYSPLGAFLGSLWYLIWLGMKQGFGIALIATIIALLPFDNAFFVYSDFKLRLWYPVLIAYWALSGRNAIVGWFNAWRAGSFLSRAATLFFALSTVVFLVLDPLDGKMSAAKYVVFSIGLVLIFREATRGSKNEEGSPLELMIVSSAIFVTLWGLLQIVAGQLGEVAPFGHYWDPYRPIPSAFFSESTWFGLYALLGALLCMKLVCSGTIPKGSYTIVAALIVAAIYSASRSVILSLLLAIGVLVLFNAQKSLGVIRRHPWRTALAALGIAIVCASIIITSWDAVSRASSEVLKKLTFQDVSGSGRVVAYEWSVDSLLRSFPLGSGFHWDPFQAINIGTFLGAKSFSITFFIGHIFGVVGLAFFAAISIRYLVSLARVGLVSVDARYAFALMIVFLFASQFTPVHQHPVGLVLPGLALAWSCRTLGGAPLSKVPIRSLTTIRYGRAIPVALVGAFAGTIIAALFFNPGPGFKADYREASYIVDKAVVKDFYYSGYLYLDVHENLSNPDVVESAFSLAGIDKLGELSLNGVETREARVALVRDLFLRLPTEGNAVKVLSDIDYSVTTLPGGENITVRVKLIDETSKIDALLAALPTAINQDYAKKKMNVLGLGSSGDTKGELITSLPITSCISMVGDPRTLRYESGELKGLVYIIRCGLQGIVLALSIFFAATIRAGKVWLVSN